MFPDLPEQGRGSTCLVTSVKGAEGMQSPAHGALRVSQISCLAPESHPGLALATLPGRPKKCKICSFTKEKMEAWPSELHFVSRFKERGDLNLSLSEPEPR